MKPSKDEAIYYRQKQTPAEEQSDKMMPDMEEWMTHFIVCHCIPPCGKKLHQVIFINSCHTFMETKKWM